MGQRGATTGDSATAKLVTSVTVFLVVCWAGVIAFDVVGDTSDGVPVWGLLFNHGPVEWLQWVLLLAAVVVAARGSVTVGGTSGRYLKWMSIGVSAMLLEDAGDIRHVLSDWTVAGFGASVGPVPTETSTDLVFFALIATVPVAAIIRFGRELLALRAVRGWLVSGYVLYGAAAIGSGLSGLGLYEQLGLWMDRWMFAGQLSIPFEADYGWSLFMFVDGAVEESVELLAVMCLLVALWRLADQRQDSDASQEVGRTVPERNE